MAKENIIVTRDGEIVQTIEHGDIKASRLIMQGLSSTTYSAKSMTVGMCGHNFSARDHMVHGLEVSALAHDLFAEDT